MSTSTWWGFVTSTSPLRVAAAVGGTGVPMSGCLVDGLVVGDRVLVLMAGTAATVLGRQGGAGVGGPVAEYSPFTPTMRTSNGTGAEPSWGNSSRAGRFAKVGSVVHLDAQFVIGSTFSPSFAVGVWSMPLPVPANVTVQGLVQVYSVASWFTGETGGFSKVEDTAALLRLWVNTGTSHELLRGDRGWAAGDRIIVTGTYESAS